MRKILFLLPTLGNGGAEKVLVNLVNNMDKEQFDITVMTLFGGGENQARLASHIKYISIMKKAPKGIIHMMKSLSPALLHKLLIKDYYDIEVSYLEGATTRIISGCEDERVKKTAWVHTEFSDKKFASYAYRSQHEAEECYQRFDLIACVSEQVKTRFCELMQVDSTQVKVQYNTNDSDAIIKFAQEPVTDCVFLRDEFNIIAVGKVNSNKGFDRLARILKRLKEAGYRAHFYIVGVGEEQATIEKYTQQNGLSQAFTFLGYKSNPYKYIKNCDLFVCSSYREGFSTAATEALIVGTPVLTVCVSGMKELLGEDNEYGVIVENNEDSLYTEICRFMDDSKWFNDYKRKATERGVRFEKAVTVRETENLFLHDLV